MPTEEKTLGILISGLWREKSWLDEERAASFYDLKGIVEAYFEDLGIAGVAFVPSERSFLEPMSNALILVQDQPVGYLGEVRRSLCKLWDLEVAPFYAELSIAKVSRYRPDRKAFTELSRYPAVERDLSIVVQESVKIKAVEEDIRQFGGIWVRSVCVFDLFRGGRVTKGYKNLGLRVTYQVSDRTLVSEDVQKLHTSIAERIVSKYQAKFQ